MPRPGAFVLRGASIARTVEMDPTGSRAVAQGCKSGFGIRNKIVRLRASLLCRQRPVSCHQAPHEGVSIPVSQRKPVFCMRFTIVNPKELLFPSMSRIRAAFTQVNYVITYL